ncbi:MAG: RidA family protein [Eubacterium sp.]|nr:RidA family protein [Eubacterium sp.]
MAEKKKIIFTDRAPQPIGPYSQAVKTGNLIFTSGVIPINPVTGELVIGGIKDQADQVFVNLVELIKASGAEPEDVVKTTVFLKNIDDFNAVNEIYENYFTHSFPARSCVEVSRLPKGVLIEIEAVIAVPR